jgi:hypothetical protein
VVLLPRVEYRAQVTHISESLCKKLFSPFMILFKNRLGFARSALSILFSSYLFYNCIPLHTHLIKAKLNFLYKWCNAFSSYFSPNFVLLKLFTLSYLMAFPQSCLTIDDFSRWLSSLALKTDWVFQTLVFYRQLGLMHKFLPTSKILLCFKPSTPILNCLPSTSPITPSLRSNLLVERLLSPYTNEFISWTDLCTLGRVPVRGNVPSWYTLLKDFSCTSFHPFTSPFAIIPSWFCPVTPDIISQTPVWILSQIPHRHISSSSFSFYIGKALTMTRNRLSVCFAHWIPNRLDDTIALCPECHLSSPYLRNNAFLTHTATLATCLFTVPLTSCVGISCIPFNFVKKRTFTLKPSWNLLEASAMDYFSSQTFGFSSISRTQTSSTNRFNYSPQVSSHHVSSTDNCFHFYIHGHYSPSPYAFRSGWTQIDSSDHQLLLSECTFNIGASFPSIQSAFLYALISIAEEVPATSIVNITFANKSFSRLSSRISDFVPLARELRCFRHITWRLFLDIISAKFLTFHFTSLLTLVDDPLLGRTCDRVVNALPDDPFLPLNYGSISSLFLINSFSEILIDTDPQYFYKQLLRIHEIIVLSSLAATKYYFYSLISPLIQWQTTLNGLQFSLHTSFCLRHRHVVY